VKFYGNSRELKVQTVKTGSGELRKGGSRSRVHMLTSLHHVQGHSSQSRTEKAKLIRRHRKLASEIAATVKAPSQAIQPQNEASSGFNVYVFWLSYRAAISFADFLRFFSFFAVTQRRRWNISLSRWYLKSLLNQISALNRFGFFRFWFRFQQIIESATVIRQ
jgi:hypothetical protein